MPLNRKASKNDHFKAHRLGHYLGGGNRPHERGSTLNGKWRLALQRQLPRTVNGETDSEVLADPSCEDEDMEELVEAEVLCRTTGLLQRIEDCAN